MSVLEILIHPDTALRKIASPVANVDGKMAELVDNMLETMYDAPGIGLAATQVDIHERVVVIDVSEECDSPLTLINPQILEFDGKAETQEGCLSIPEVYETITRPASLRFSAIDREGNPYEMDADGMLACCIQHEIDHLDGKLFIDYLSPLKQSRIRKKMLKMIRDGFPESD